LFRFVTKQICLFRLFLCRFETPKQTEIFFWFHETNQNKRETALVSVCFGSNRNLFLFVSRTPYSYRSSNEFSVHVFIDMQHTLGTLSDKYKGDSQGLPARQKACHSPHSIRTSRRALWQSFSNKGQEAPPQNFLPRTPMALEKSVCSRNGKKVDGAQFCMPYAYMRIYTKL
jgi:hypothetical protein